MLSESYRNTLREMHRLSDRFGSKSWKWKDRIKAIGYTDILDYGCGKGNLGLECQKYDPGVKEFSALPKPADLIVCTDVLEHVEPEYIDQVLSHIKSLMKKAGYFVIVCRPSKEILPDGRNAHILVRDRDWWEAKLSEYFAVFIKEIGNQEIEVHATLPTN